MDGEGHTTIADTSRFSVGEGGDLGWLGHFIGKSDSIEYLRIWYLPDRRYQTNIFFEGMSQNRSIKDLTIYVDIGAVGWTRL